VPPLGVQTEAQVSATFGTEFAKPRIVRGLFRHQKGAFLILQLFLRALARYRLPVIPIATIFAMIPVNDFLNRWLILSSRLKSPAGI